MERVAIIGAGVAGAVLAHALRGRAEVALFDKSRGAGGRLSTRRVAGPGGVEWAFDHGAPFFQADDPDLVTALRASGGLAAPWAGAWVGAPAMTAWPRALIAESGAALHPGTRITALERANGLWTPADANGRAHGPFARVVLAIPAPQAAALAPAPLAHALADVEMAPCWALMLGFAPGTPLPAGPMLPTEALAGPLAAIALNHTKPGRPAAPAAVAYAAAPWSRAHLEDEPEDIAQALAPVALAALGGPAPAHVSAHRWRYAYADGPAQLYADAELGIAACGDWAGGGGVQGAWASALALAGSGFFSAR
jgi:renalase